jgi:3-oxoacyl-[acyl-carrier protein] reductase
VANQFVIDLSPRVALVTGGSRGIGRAVSELLATSGARVVINYRRNAEAAREVVEGLRAVGAEAACVAADVADPSQARRLAEEAARIWGRLDILVNNAGILSDNRAGEGDLQALDRVFHVNARGAFLVLDAAVSHLERAGGSVVFLSSTAGLRGSPGRSAYAASKAALISYTRSLGSELGRRGVRVNCVAPGWTRTDMTRDALADPERRREIEASIPLGRVASPADVAGAVLFLVSELARHVNGEVVNVNGGSVTGG